MSSLFDKFISYFHRCWDPLIINRNTNALSVESGKNNHTGAVDVAVQLRERHFGKSASAYRIGEIERKISRCISCVIGASLEDSFMRNVEAPVGAALSGLRKNFCGVHSLHDRCRCNAQVITKADALEVWNHNSTDECKQSHHNTHFKNGVSAMQR